MRAPSRGKGVCSQSRSTVADRLYCTDAPVLALSPSMLRRWAPCTANHYGPLVCRGLGLSVGCLTHETPVRGPVSGERRLADDHRAVVH